MFSGPLDLGDRVLMFDHGILVDSDPPLDNQTETIVGDPRQGGDDELLEPLD